jgi:hypothetical protein
MPYTETMTHRQWAEIAAKKRSPFRPHRGLAALDLFLDTMLNRRIWEACPIDCTKALGNKYGNISQTCHPKSKTYSGAQLRGARRGEAGRRWKCCWTTATSSLELWGHNIIAGMMTWSTKNTASRETPSSPFLVHQISKWFYDTSTGTTIRVAHFGLLLEGLRLSYARARWT